MKKAIIGIDPGSKGYITLSYYNEEKNKNEYKFFSLIDNSPQKLGVILKDIKYMFNEVIAVMEEVHAIFGSSSKATFSFGQILGLLKGLLIANGIPYNLVQPKEWQSEIWINEDKKYIYNKEGKKKINTKGTSLNAAIRLFPNIDLKRTPACKKPDDNKVDSLLICEYARRKNF